MARELFAHRPITTVSSGGTDDPSSGTVQEWTVASSASFPGASYADGSVFHVVDPEAPDEVVMVTDVDGSTWTVIRGAQGTTPVTHEASFTVHGVVTSAWLTEQSDLHSAQTDRFLRQVPFFIPHRGSGGEFPEHSRVAYDSAVGAGAEALEISCVASSDRVVFTMHDPTLDRTTTGTGLASDRTWADLKNNVKVVDKGLLGGGWEPQELMTVREALDRYLGKVTIFLEGKTNDAITPLIQLLDNRYPGAHRSVIWKVYYNSGTKAGMRARGYKVWAYVDAGTSDMQMDAVDDDVDMWGVPFNMTDTRIAEIVARGKPVICWEVHRQCDVDRLTALGVVGMMSSQWQYLTKQPFLDTDRFSSRISIPGTLGTSNYNPDRALHYTADGWAYIPSMNPSGAVLAGGHTPEDGENYVIEFAMKYETLPSNPAHHSGIAFGREWDDPYAISTALDTYPGTRSPGGYHLVIRGDTFGIYSHTQGSTSGEVLGGGEISMPARQAGVPMYFRVTVSPTQVIAQRLDGPSAPYTVTANHTTWRGRRWHFSNHSVIAENNYTVEHIPYFGEIEVS